MLYFECYQRCNDEREAMPRKEPENSEYVIVSPEDAELLDFFSLRRTFEPDGSIRYVQLIGDVDLIQAALHNKDLAAEMISDAGKKGKRKKGSYSLPRMVAARMLGYPLTDSEVVVQKNDKRGDVRRTNLEITSRADLATGKRIAGWSRTGTKYVYLAVNGKYYGQVGNHSLGTYATKEEASAAVDSYLAMVESGVPADEARLRIINRSRNKGRILIMS